MENVSNLKILGICLILLVLFGLVKDCSKPVPIDASKAELQKAKVERQILEKKNESIDEQIKKHYEKIDSLNNLKSVNLVKIEQYSSPELQAALDSLFN